MSLSIIWLPHRTWWVSKGGWEGHCACLPGLGMTPSPLSSPAINRVCVLGAGDTALQRCSCGGCGWSVTTDDVCCCVSSASLLCGRRSLFGWSWGMGGVVDGGGGKEEATWQCLSHSCRIWEDRCRGWDLFSFCFMYNKAFVAQVA